MIYSCDIFYIQSVSVTKISIKFHKSMLTLLLMIISMEPFCMKHLWVLRGQKEDEMLI